MIRLTPAQISEEIHDYEDHLVAGMKNITIC